MSNRLWSGTCAAITLGLVAGLAAQNPPTTPPSQTSTRDSASKNITVTGCLQKAPSGATGTTGSSTSSTSSRSSSMTDAKFVLTSASAGATGTSGTTSSTAVASEYRLDADDAKLTPHVGHKVEITGTVDQTTSATSPSQPPTASASSAANSPKLKVDSVKMVAATCP